MSNSQSSNSTTSRVAFGGRISLPLAASASARRPPSPVISALNGGSKPTATAPVADPMKARSSSIIHSRTNTTTSLSSSSSFTSLKLATGRSPSIRDGPVIPHTIQPAPKLIKKTRPPSPGLSGRLSHTATINNAHNTSSSPAASARSTHNPPISSDRTFIRDIAAIQSWLISIKQTRNAEQFRDTVNAVKSLIFTPQQAKSKRTSNQGNSNQENTKSTESANKAEPANKSSNSSAFADSADASDSNSLAADEAEFSWIDSALSSDKLTRFITKSESTMDDNPLIAPSGVVFENGKWRKVGESKEKSESASENELKFDDSESDNNNDNADNGEELSIGGKPEIRSQTPAENEIEADEFDELDDIPDFDEPPATNERKSPAPTPNKLSQTMPKQPQPPIQPFHSHSHSVPTLTLNSRFPDAPLDSNQLSILEDEIQIDKKSRKSKSDEIDYPMDLQISDDEEEQQQEGTENPLESNTNTAAKVEIATAAAGPAGRELNEFEISSSVIEQFHLSSSIHNELFDRSMKKCVNYNNQIINEINQEIQLNFILEQAEALQWKRKQKKETKKII